MFGLLCSLGRFDFQTGRLFSSVTPIGSFGSVVSLPTTVAGAGARVTPTLLPIFRRLGTVVCSALSLLAVGFDGLAMFTIFLGFFLFTAGDLYRVSSCLAQCLHAPTHREFWALDGLRTLFLPSCCGWWSWRRRALGFLFRGEPPFVLPVKLFIGWQRRFRRWFPAGFFHLFLLGGSFRQNAILFFPPPLEGKVLQVICFF